MFKSVKSILVAVAILGSSLGFVACNKNGSAFNEPATPRNETAVSSPYQSIEEIIDDEPSLGGAREAAADPNAVYQVLKVTAQFSTTGTNASAALAVINGAVATATLSATAVTTAAGYKKFSVKSDKFSTFLKRKVDKSQAQTYYMLDRDAKTYKRCGSVSANGATFDFLPTYLKTGITIGAGTLANAALQ